MSRIYKVVIKHGLQSEEKLIRSINKSGAIRHVAAKCIAAEVASQDDVLRLARAGYEVENSSNEIE